jgi:hypothetical protein
MHRDSLKSIQFNSIQWEKKITNQRTIIIIIVVIIINDQQFV